MTKYALHDRTPRGPRFRKGHAKVPGSGRAPGTPNHVSADAKALMDALIEHQLVDAQDVYDQLKRRSPKAALLALAALAEYRLPKLQRRELTGPGGGPVAVVEVRRYVDSGAAVQPAAQTPTCSEPRDQQAAAPALLKRNS